MLNLQAIEAELKEHAKVAARNALSEERQVLAELHDHLKALESGAVIEEGKAYLAKVTAQVEAKIKNIQDNLQSNIAQVKLDIENCLQRIEEHKVNSRGSGKAAPEADQNASAPAPGPVGVVLDQSGSPAPAPSAPALNDAGVTTPTPPPASGQS